MKFFKHLMVVMILLNSGLSLAYERDRFCTGWLSGYNPKTQYYSAVFKADFVSEHSKQFAKFVEEQYGVYLKLSTCTYYGWERESKMEDDPFRVVDTNWKPKPFERQELQNFHISVSSSDREIQVCVRDHECEDGDKIKVSVNGNTVFRGEIDNNWECNSVDVSKGKNTIKLYAINGSGNKGSCSYADANTGEIKIKGSNTQSQQWKHRGGKGSSADIVIDID